MPLSKMSFNAVAVVASISGAPFIPFMKAFTVLDGGKRISKQSERGG